MSSPSITITTKNGLKRSKSNVTLRLEKEQHIDRVILEMGLGRCGETEMG